MTRARTNADNVTADIAGITAGTGITGGGTSGTVTITNDMATTIAAKGDILAGTANDAYSALTVGTNGQVLTAASSAATGLEWATVAAGANFTLLNAGGTALTGAMTITVSGISNKDKILVLIAGASSVNADAEYTIRFNADGGSNYSSYGSKIGGDDNGSEYARGSSSFSSTGATSIPFGRMCNTGSGTVSGGLSLTGGATAGVKSVIFTGAGVASGGQTGQITHSGQGIYSSASTISSVSILSNNSNFDAGTIYVYTSA